MVVNVWGSWCPPCREELPWFAALDEAAAGRLQVIGVDVADTANSALSTLASLGVHYPSIFDPESKTRMSLQWFGGTPVTLLVRADGTIAHRIEGRVPDEATLQALVAEHLGVDVR
jgi:thiol-disulfide isomerase/thioredoxin